ncbi:MAG UNVERIFIED_CONTAM: host specificity protein [Rickettsiaceae bacterium]|jgi:hypothetical protein
MLEQILGSLGSFVGKMMGGGIISTALRFAGKNLGRYLSEQNYVPNHHYHFGTNLK